MNITDENVIEEVSKFLNSESWKLYKRDFSNAYNAALFESEFDDSMPVKDQLNALLACKMLQCFWEFLPDTPNIRYGAFFNLCDFGEYYCFGE